MLVGIGINYQTAPVEIREKVTFSESDQQHQLPLLLAEPDIKEAAILSTCNRTEIYCSSLSPNTQTIVDWLRSIKQLKQEQITPYIYKLQGEALIQHMMRVASGLNSLILGEPQILGQMKQAHALSKQAGTVHQYLDRLFQITFQTAKAVRSQTEIGQYSVSVAYAATRLAHQIFGALETRTALLIGAGETIQLVAEHLKKQGIKQLYIANRNPKNAAHLVNTLNATCLSLDQIPSHLHLADIVISSTAAPIPVLGKGAVETALTKRLQSPILLVDLAVPRDIEPETGNLSNAYLYGIDDLQNILEHNQNRRKKASIEAEAIIKTHQDVFNRWLQTTEISPFIQRFREQAHDQKTLLLQQATQQLNNGEDPQTVLSLFANTLTNKLIHNPTLSIKEAGESGDLETIKILLNTYDKTNKIT